MSPYLIMRIIPVINKVYKDKAVLYSLLGTSWRVLFAPVSLYLVALKLTPEILGIYYVFFSIAGLQSIFEAGFSHTIVQSISHEMHSVSFAKGKLTGDQEGIQRIQEAMKLGFTWFSIIAVACIVLICPIGYFIIGSQSHIIGENVWLTPWICFIITFSLNILFYPVNFFFEGILRLEKIYRIRLIIQVLTSIVFAVGLFLNWGIYVTSVGSLCSLLINLSVLLLPNRAQFKYFWGLPSLRYFKSVFKWQLKISIVWCSGYLYWQLPSVLIFSILGPVISGQYGFTINVINAINNVGQIFVRTKSAVIGKLRAAGDFIGAYSVYITNSKYSYSLIILGFLSIILLWIVFPSLIIWERMMPIVPSVSLMIAFAINMITLNQAMFARCSKEEPFFYLSMFVNFTFPMVFYMCIKVFPNYWGIIIPFIIIHLIELIWGCLIFNKKYNKWI